MHDNRRSALLLLNFRLIGTFLSSQMLSLFEKVADSSSSLSTVLFFRSNLRTSTHNTKSRPNFVSILGQLVWVWVFRFGFILILLGLNLYCLSIQSLITTSSLPNLSDWFRSYVHMHRNCLLFHLWLSAISYHSYRGNLALTIISLGGRYNIFFLKVISNINFIIDLNSHWKYTAFAFPLLLEAVLISCKRVVDGFILR